MGFDSSVDVCSAAESDFVTVAVENCVKIVRGWEVFVNEFEERFGNVE